MLRKILLLIFGTLLLLPAATGHANDSSLKPRLGCIPFMATSLQAMAFTEDISSSLLNSIDRSRYFEIIERKKIEQFLELEGFRLDNLDQEIILRLSGKGGLDYVVYGNVNAGESGTALELNLLNVRSRKVLLRETFNISQADFSRKLMEIASMVVERVKAGLIQPQTLTAPAALKAPSGLEVSGTASSIRLKWKSDMQQVAGFHIYRGSSSGGHYTQHATTSETSFTDENLKLNEEFYYRVASVSHSGVTSELTPPVKGGTSVAPPPPIFMNVEPDIKGARLTWRHRPGSSSDARAEAHGYRIYRRLSDETSFALVANVPPDAVSYADVDLKDGVKYVYTIVAHNRDGIESEYSSKLSVVTLNAPNPVRAVKGKIRHVPLAWDRYTADQAEGYRLFRSEKKDGPYSLVARIANIATTSYTDHELKDNATYWYRITAYKAGDLETAASEPVSVVTRDIPPAPVNISAISEQPRMVTIKWQLAGTSEDEIQSVIVYRALDDKAATLEKMGEVSQSHFEYTDNKLNDKTTYYYRLATRNSGGASSLQSPVVSGTTKAVPAAPVNLTATSGGVKNSELIWDKNREGDIKEYQIFVKRPEDIDFKQIKELTENRYRDSELKDGAEYAYKIRAIDKDGLVSGFSSTVLVRTKPLPAKVYGLNAVDTINRMIAWKPNQEKDVHSYNVYKKGFMGAGQKLATVQGTQWKVEETKGNIELYVTALDDSGLESEPSDAVVFKER